MPLYGKKVLIFLNIGQKLISKIKVLDLITKIISILVTIINQKVVKIKTSCLVIE